MRGLALRRALLVGSLLGAGCARPGAPPGGTPVRSPPIVISTTPAQLAVVPGFKGPVWIRFNRTLSERGFDATTVAVSPVTGRPDAKRKGSDIEVKIPGGWRANTIYRIVLAPTLRDRFGNQIRNPFELVFSTGPAIPATVLGGYVSDRLTGKPSSKARVEAELPGDSLRYAAVTDLRGVFVMRHLPVGRYTVRAYLDQNQNDSLNAFEPRDSVSVELADGDTTLVALRLLPNDTTPARLITAEAVDSLHIKLDFDDYFTADTSLTGYRAVLWRLPDSLALPVVVLQKDGAYKAEQKAEQKLKAPPDTTRKDTTAKGTPPRDTTARPSGRRPGSGAAGQQPTPPPPLPSRSLYARLAVPLAPATEYRITVEGLTNISGLPGGGGSATFQTPKQWSTPERKDTTAAARDTSAARRDTSAARRDTSASARDTGAVHRDTSAVRRDTSAARRDTSATARDTGAVHRDTSAVRPDTGVVRKDTTAVQRDTGSVRRDTSMEAAPGRLRAKRSAAWWEYVDRRRP